ncbi:GTPase [uncultured Winogradskyella sp.]|uniref:GTPase n=1 Tax=uncultured Winogradskyella sp. TaxID=395353 RepID=UPI00260549B4|nr:GTPase [uncultured Winogradskyella sp.]|tara:strand:+ start:4062 stop:4409 length:348 start_codon:yes stop_codon:yes gene_type:complete
MKLLFVYNATSGTLNSLLDVGHKLLSPSTYKCSLCTLTHDVFSENSTWKNFRDKSHFDMEFYHKDEFEAKFPKVKLAYPTVLKLEENQLSTVLNPDVLNEIATVEALIEMLKSRI